MLKVIFETADIDVSELTLEGNVKFFVHFES